mgnify:CR=1 FL=1
MPIVVGVQFKPVTKVYHFDSTQLLDLAHQDYVVVDTARGPEVAQVVQPPNQIGDEEVVGEMKSVLRRANPWDMVQRDMWQHKEQEALAICRDILARMNGSINVDSAPGRGATFRVRLPFGSLA